MVPTTGATAVNVPKTLSFFATHVEKPSQSNWTRTRRAAATHTLLSSERTYARDLVFIRDVLIPLAQGKPVRMPSSATPSTNSRLGSSQSTGSTASNSFTSPPHSGPPMTSNDVPFVFRNINDITSLSSQLVNQLETAFEHSSNNGDEDNVGEIFLEIIPQLELLYRTYLRTQPAALAYLRCLSLSPAYWSYPSNIRSLLSSGARVPDLPSFLMKPEQRVTEYCHLLASIIDATPVSHKCMTALVQARGWMERVAVDLKKEKEANELPQLEVRLHEYPIFLDTLAEHIKNWGIASRRSVASLQQWSITFGALLGHQPSPSVPAHEAFTSLLSSLADLCRALEDNIQTSLYPLFHELKAIMENPKRFLDEMHALELPRARCPLWKLFRRLDTLDRAIGLAIHKVVQEFLGVVKEKWIHFFNSLTEEGECYGGTEETLRAWQMRWEVAQRQLLFWAQTFLSRSELEALLPANAIPLERPSTLRTASMEGAESGCANCLCG
ncbi:Dbl homology (DH) domain containing protein [Tylopilus felleus]